jgi:hypothetical protein
VIVTDQSAIPVGTLSDILKYVARHSSCPSRVAGDSRYRLRVPGRPSDSAGKGRTIAGLRATIQSAFFAVSARFAARRTR